MDLTLDFETYYDRDYSLKKLTTIDYVRDDRFHVHGAAVQIDDQEPAWFDADGLDRFLHTYAVEDVTLIAHNTFFDGLVLVERFNWRPHRWVDTLAMVRALLPELPRRDLDYLGQVLGLGGKIEGLADTKGVRELSPEAETKLAEYAKNDVRITRELYKLLAPHMPADELELLHITTRGSVDGRVFIDVPRVETALELFKRQRRETIAASGYKETQLSSNPQFAAILESLGIEPPMKTSPANGQPTLALAKDDLAFNQLMAKHPEHRALWDARLESKSSILISRAERFIKIGTTGNGTLPMPLNYYGAHTGRWSGRDKVNVQNLPTDREGAEKAELRKSIIAPDGYVILVIDSAQIELRVNAWFCGQEDSLEILRSGGDIYSYTAARHFGYEVTKKTHPNERQFGKLLELALGYGMGWNKFQTQAALGVMGVPPTRLSDHEAQQTVNGYRASHWAISTMWRTLQNHLPMLARQDCSRELGPVHFEHQAIRLPNGMALQYPNLECTEEGDWVYGPHGHKPSKIYGGLMLENIIQALARIVVAEQILRLDQHPLFHTISTTHDEGLFLVPEQHADEATQIGLDTFSTPPAWAPDLPVGAEGGYAKEYSK